MPSENSFHMVVPFQTISYRAEYFNPVFQKFLWNCGSMIFFFFPLSESLLMLAWTWEFLSDISGTLFFWGGGIITNYDYVSKLLVMSSTYCSSMVVKQWMLDSILLPDSFLALVSLTPYLLPYHSGSPWHNFKLLLQYVYYIVGIKSTCNMSDLK